MQKSKVAIRGSNILSMLDSVTKIDSATTVPEGDYLLKCGNAYVLTYEKCSIQTNLMVTLIFNFKDENTCEIDIISGGMSRGIIYIFSNPEKSSNSDIKKILKEICESEKWDYSDIS